MKRWVQKIAEQLDIDWSQKNGNSSVSSLEGRISEERATLIYIIDNFNKHLIDLETQPSRKVREILDDFTKQLLSNEQSKSEKLLFRIRQFFSSYRIDEYTYIKKSFDDFRGIIWDLVDQLSEDIEAEEDEDKELNLILNNLRDAVEANSIDVLRTQSRVFIDSYVAYQSKKERRREFRMDTIRKNLAVVKKQLIEANQNMNTDHLTGAYNRRSFDEQIKKLHKMYSINKVPISILSLDIDHFKKINDNYGHDIGDFILKECVKMLKEIFYRDTDFIARVGGEEFIVILPDHNLEAAILRAESALNRIRSEVFVKEEMRLQFTISLGIAQLTEKEELGLWLKRADDALYESKKTGRNKYTVSQSTKLKVA